MSKIEQFSALVGDIYDASLDPSLWSGVLEKMCTFVPGSIGNIFIQDAAARRANASFGWGNDPYYEKLYLEKLCRINPLFPAILLQKVGEVFSTTDIITNAQMEQTRFYREYLRPQNIGPAIGCVLEKSATSCAILAFPRTVALGQIDEKALNRVRLLVPHIQRAVLIGKAIDLQKATAEMLVDTVDSVSAAVYLVDENSRIVHANRTGLDLLAKNDFLRGPGGALQVQNAVIDRILRNVLAAGAMQNDLAAAAKGASLGLRDRDGGEYVAHVLLLNSGQRRKAVSNHSAVAAVFVQKAVMNPSLPELIAKQHRLTRAELGVIFAIIEVGGVPEVASVLGLAETTIKTHLRNIYAKTGTKRQADLVKFVAKFANSFAR